MWQAEVKRLERFMDSNDIPPGDFSRRVGKMIENTPKLIKALEDIGALEYGAISEELTVDELAAAIGERVRKALDQVKA